MTLKYTELLRIVLNETLNGFTIENFDVAIGMRRSELEQLLAQLNDLPPDVEMRLNKSQTKAFRNALYETLRELGIEEFHTRTGFDFEKGQQVLKELDQLIPVAENFENPYA